MPTSFDFPGNTRAPLALSIAQDAFISKNQIDNGLNNVVKNTALLGRWQIIQEKPTIVFDNGHNKDGISQIIKELKKIKYKKLHFIYGSVNDKDINEILKILPKDALYYFCEAKIPRSLDKFKLYQKAKNFKLKGQTFDNIKNAFIKAKTTAKDDDCILVGGSTFIVAELLLNFNYKTLNL